MGFLSHKCHINEFVEKIARLKDHGIISEDELNRIANALTTKKSIAIDELLERLSKLKE
jgi:hypothetical protein